MTYAIKITDGEPSVIAMGAPAACLEAAVEADRDANPGDATIEVVDTRRGLIQSFNGTSKSSREAQAKIEAKRLEDQKVANAAAILRNARAALAARKLEEEKKAQDVAEAEEAVKKAEVDADLVGEILAKRAATASKKKVTKKKAAKA